MRQLLSGVLAALSLVAALGFRRLAKKAADRFFDWFAAAFLLLGVNGVALGLAKPGAEGSLPLYGLRLVAFTVILVAIWDKNRR